MEPKQKSMGEMADVLKRLYAEDLAPGPRSPKKNGGRHRQVEQLQGDILVQKESADSYSH